MYMQARSKREIVMSRRLFAALTGGREKQHHDRTGIENGTVDRREMDQRRSLRRVPQEFEGCRFEEPKKRVSKRFNDEVSFLNSED